MKNRSIRALALNKKSISNLNVGIKGGRASITGTFTHTFTHTFTDTFTDTLTDTYTHTSTDTITDTIDPNDPTVG